MRDLAYCLLLLVGLCLLVSCGDPEPRSKSPRIKNSTYIITPKRSDRYTLAEVIPVEVGLRADTLSIRQIVVRSGLDTLAVSSETKLALSPTGKVGDLSLNINTMLSNGKTETYSVTAKVFSDRAPDEYTYRVINSYPHDPEAYTQGLLVIDGELYESTGQRGASDLRITDMSTGRPTRKLPLEDRFFGEGLTVFEDQLYQLTWTSNLCLVYDRTTLKRTKTFDYPTEGWGLATMGNEIVMSDGTDNLYFRDPDTFEVLRQGQVRDDQRPVSKLNELEYIDGLVYANVYPTDEIVMINPGTFAVEGRINLAGILNTNNYDRPLDVLNGIAYDKAKSKMYVTGKLWPKLFEIELVKKQNL